MAQAGRLVGAGSNPFVSPAQAAWNPQRYMAQAAGPAAAGPPPLAHGLVVVLLLIGLVALVAYHRREGPFKKKG